jgi:hypothetical protein
MHQPRHDFLAQPLALMARQHGDIAKMGAIVTIGQDAASYAACRVKRAVAASIPAIQPATERPMASG